MAEFPDGFDWRATADIALPYSIYSVVGAGFTSVSITSAAGRNGTNGVRIIRNTNVDAATSFTALATMPTAARYKVAFARRWSTLPPPGQYRTIATVRDAGTVQCDLRLYGDGSLQVVRGGSAITGGASVGGIVVANAYNHYEWDITVNNTTGASQLVVNGTTSVLSFSGQNTRVTANNQITEAGLRLAMSNTTLDLTFNDDFDDLCIHDAVAFIGDCRVGYFKPNGAGTYGTFTPNGAGTLYQCVNEAANDGDTTYTSSSTIGQKETFTVEDVPASAVIKFAQDVWVMKKTDSGTRTIAPRTKSGASEALGSNVVPTTAYASYRQANNTDPATGVTWTAAGFNGAEFGEEITT